MSFLRALLKHKHQHHPLSDRQQSSGPQQLSIDLTDNLQQIKQLMGSSSDLICRQYTIGRSGHACAFMCIDGLVDKTFINEQLSKNIMLRMSEADKQAPASPEEIVELLRNEVLTVDEMSTARTLDDVVEAILAGDTALFVSGTAQALVIDSKGWPTRSVEEPQTEALIRGPRDGFTENIRTNSAHVRRRLRDPHLRFDAFKIGRRAKKDVLVAYVEGIVNPRLVQEVKRRLKTIDMDDAEGSGFIEQWISDSFLSPFPLILSTERPDKVTGALLQGKVAILVDGTPFTLILPVTISSLIQSPEDYYSPWLISTLIRFLRCIAAFIATFLPAFYIALVEFHHGMIPSKLVFSIAATREGVPFPAVIEALVMETTLEVLREAGIRLPKPIGQTIGIVGGLVIGEAAVAAGFVSPIMVIVVAITAVSSFAIPSYAFAISFRILRFGIMLAAAFFGLYGVILAYIMINIHIVNLTSFGIPYSAPFAPTLLSDWKDLVWRAPATILGKRPRMLQTEDEDRMNK